MRRFKHLVVAGLIALLGFAPPTLGQVGGGVYGPSGGGSGTVTSVSVTSANGVSGTVANATTTPAITLALGAITPTSVAIGGATIGTDALAITGTATISGQFNANGVIAAAAGAVGTPSIFFGTATTGFYARTNSAINIAMNSVNRYEFGISGDISVGGSVAGLYLNGSNAATASDAIFRRRGAANMMLGNADVDTAPVAQTLSMQGALAGGTSNVAGANATFAMSQGKGTGVGGSFIVQVAPAGSTGTVVNALATALTIDSTKLAAFPGTVSIGAGSAITSSGAGGALGSNAFTSTAYAPLASPTFTGTVVLPSSTALTTPALSWPTYSVSNAVAAAGTTQSGATVLTSDFNFVTTATSNQGVALPTSAAGQDITVGNFSGATIKVYPANGSSGTIDTAAANVAVSIQNNGILVFKARDTSSNWKSTAKNFQDAAYVTGALTNSITSITTSGLMTSGSVTSAGTITLSGLASDAAQTDNTVCVSGAGVLLKGSGTIGICLGTSSARYKTNIVPGVDGIDQIAALKPVNYNYLKGYGDDGARRQYGFLAEDVVGVLPGLVGLDETDRPNTVDIVGMVPVMVTAIQQMKARLDAAGIK